MAFESMILNRKAIAFDLNPLSTFVIETTLHKIDEDKFRNAVNRITYEIEKDDVYKNNYIRKINDETLIIYNYIWYKDKVTKVKVKSIDGKERPDLQPSQLDDELINNFNDIDMKYWYPTGKLPLNPSIN